MSEHVPVNDSRVRAILRGISLRGHGAVLAFASFSFGVALSLPLASWIDNTRFYRYSGCALLLPVMFALAASAALAARGQSMEAANVFAALLGLCILSAIAAVCTVYFIG